MKNLILRKALIERKVHLYEVAQTLGTTVNTLRDYMHYEWPETIQKDVIDLMDGTSDKESADIRRDISNYISEKRVPLFGSAGGYAAKVMREVQEWELRREKEREGWY